MLELLRLMRICKHLNRKRSNNHCAYGAGDGLLPAWSATTQAPFEGPPIIKPPALLRNNIDGDELEPEFTRTPVGSKPGQQGIPRLRIAAPNPHPPTDEVERDGHNCRNLNQRQSHSCSSNRDPYNLKSVTHVPAGLSCT